MKRKVSISINDQEEKCKHLKNMSIDGIVEDTDKYQMRETNDVKISLNDLCMYESSKVNN